MGGLSAARLLAPPGRSARPRPAGALAVALAALVVAGLGLQGPLAAGWSARAGAQPQRRGTLLARPRPSPACPTVGPPPFSARFAGSVRVSPVDRADA